jgi:hypothetical protein
MTICVRAGDMEIEEIGGMINIFNKNQSVDKSKR